MQRVQAKPHQAAAGTSFVETDSKLGEDPAPVDVAKPDGMLRHIGHYTGLEGFMTKEDDAQASLERPENIVFKRVSSGFFSCIDPRADYGVMGTPGGDAGEFLIGLQALETKNGKPFFLDDVNSLFQQYLRLMPTRGKKLFYFNTDEAAVKALATATGATDPLKPSDFTIRNKVLSECTKPEHIGSQHLKAILAAPADYGIRKELVEYFISIFYSIYFDASNPLRERLLFVTLKGDFAQATGGAYIYSPDECPGIAPLLVPDVGGTKVSIFHAAHVKFYRQDLARFFSFQNGAINIDEYVKEFNRIAALSDAKAAAAFSGAWIDVIFTSLWDRWPF